ncbi:MAG: cytochrome c, partial [Steroidobacteraceae bacterium]
RGLLAIGLLSGVAMNAAAAGDVQAGMTKASTVCIACHGLDGNSVNPEWPSIAGQHESYIIKQVKAFRAGQRSNVLMSPIALTLTDKEIEDTAAYYASQKIKGLEAAKSKVELGQSIYRGGVTNRNVPACMACHGPNGRGNPGAIYPSLRSQHATQVVTQLQAYRKGERSTDQNQMMRDVAAKLTDEQIDAVAQYIQGLR